MNKVLGEVVVYLGTQLVQRKLLYAVVAPNVRFWRVVLIINVRNVKSIIKNCGIDKCGKEE